MDIFIHLLNDFSGSPRIINEKIVAYRKLGRDCMVITGGDGGFIDTSVAGARIVSYEKHPHRAVWAFRLLVWHLRTFVITLRHARRGDTVHASTMLTTPHLAAAKLKGANTVCHVMETRVSPAVHKRIVLYCLRSFSDRVVFLSEYVRSALSKDTKDMAFRITYPCVDQKILDGAAKVEQTESVDRKFTVGLICSMVWHKGYVEFIELSRMRPDYHFLLVMNGNADEFGRRHPAGGLPPNLEILFNQPDIARPLSRMDMLVSMTKREGWIETFGLTLMEAMAFGIPVIAPDVGAPREYVEHGINGFLVDESNLDEIGRVIDGVATDPATYSRLSNAARQTSRSFTPRSFLESVKAELQFLDG